MNKQHLIWSILAIITGVLGASFLFKITAFSATKIESFFISDEDIKSFNQIEETNDVSELNTNDLDFEIKNNQLEKNNFDVLNNKENKIILNDIGNAWGKVKGLTMFRGNPSRSFYGSGEIPNTPQTKWKYPKEKMCSPSISGGKKSIWCGTGWTGQPVAWEKENGDIEIIFGAYDKGVHFVDAKTGIETRKTYFTEDIIKGSVTLDPDGFPLLYFGSRDNKLRILSLDRDDPELLWELDSKNLGGIWNDDWDGNPVVINDILYEGGENGWFYAIKLNRKINEDNLVEVLPEIVFSMPSYTKELIELVDENMGIENSLVFFKDRVYFANSGGRILGLDVSNIEKGIAPIVFDYWAGDDIDATMVVDKNGMLYVSVELERFNKRSEELGQLIKLDPYKEDDPYVWGIPVPKDEYLAGGIWATPALYKNYLYVPTHTGKFLGVNIESGEIVWQEKIDFHSWSSPVIVEDELLIGACGGDLRKYSLNNPENPTLVWSYRLGSGACIESTPAVWGDFIYVGTRDGYFYRVGEKIN